MRDDVFKRRLKRAEAHQNFTKSPYTRYTQAAKRKFGNNRIFPLIIPIISIYCYAHRKISDAKKAARYEEHEDIEKQALRWNGTVARWTIILAVVGIIAAYFNYRTLLAIQGQLEEMKSGSIDAHNLAQAAVDQAIAAKNTAKTAQDSFVSNQRAWVGPTDANITIGALGTVVNGNIVYVNSGKDPAKMELTQVQKIYNQESWDNSDAAVDIRTNQINCFSKSGVNGERFAWPTSGFNSYNSHFPNGKLPQIGVITWNENSLSGASIITVQGCFTYTTIDKLHHTSFCYFFKGRESDPTHLGICNLGNSAD